MELAKAFESIYQGNISIHAKGRIEECNLQKAENKLHKLLLELLNILLNKKNKELQLGLSKKVL